MGFTLLVYSLQLLTGLLFRWARQRSPAGRDDQGDLPGEAALGWSASWAPRLRSLHWSLGWLLVSLVLLLLSIGIVGTLGHFGSLGQSVHLWAGGSVVLLVLASALSSRLIGRHPWGRSLHLSLNGGLLLALAWVSWSGWSVVQKYLP